MCVRNLRYPACNAHAPYFHLWPARLHDIFPHYLINGTTFGKESLNKKVCFDILYNFCHKCLITKRIQQDVIKIYIGLHVQYPYSCQILIKPKFSRQIFEKYSDIKFHKNASFGSRVVPYRRTDIQISNFIKMLPLGAELFHAEGRTDGQS